MEAKEQRKLLKIPPVVESIEEEIENIFLGPEKPIHWENTYNIWSRNTDLRSLLWHRTTRPHSSIKPIRDHATGQIIDWKEDLGNVNIQCEDYSMKRQPLPPQQATRGNVNNFPFLPAGYAVEDKVLGNNGTDLLLDTDDDKPGFFMGEEILCIAPSLNDGIFFEEDGMTPIKNENDTYITNTNTMADEVNIEKEVVLEIENMDMKTIAQSEDVLGGIWTDSEVKTAKESKSKVESKPQLSEDERLFEECVIQPVRPMPDLPVLNISKSVGKQVLGSTEWAEMLDISKPMDDFHKLIPNMAHHFPFELDTFQKQAILKLEEQGHVFVAAHTSAGKTVVAEYAIALSKKHCTRTVYTSPIKALSNQKYRDFLQTFGDVGLLTGDLQINTNAACLVMTTEILRSMLYRGSDVVRDLEYVIFDEVHYINNEERGYVWEEVLILLPAHVSIVMLSATVPNTLEFADWVGRTKRRKVYVVSTLKRPVPLCHYLYTGSSGSSKDERFLVVNQDGVFVQKGFEKAIAAKKDRSSNYNKEFGVKGTRNHLNLNQEQTMWIAFISHLQKNNMLPVVAFVLSRNRCDKISEALSSVDLTTAREKGRIHTFIQMCLRRLKEPDRKLPQVMRMASLLSSGIGVHHSGILPILKEIVEMLFQCGLVKILFATETFAMGVNMPARTVVFDSVSKFDGVGMRPLLPAEYIQMAGRAGRRGLDDTGAVIILCKRDVPESFVLKQMMQGKPTKLSSQFRVTYSTMLCLLRATSVSVESIMQRSFREFGQQCKADTYKKQLEELEKIMEEERKQPLDSHLALLVEFYNAAADYIEELSDLMPVILEQPTKHILPGRVLVISIGRYVNQLALFLNMQGSRLVPYKVLILDIKLPEEDDTVDLNKNDLWYLMCGLAKGLNKIGSDSTTLQHKIICISSKNIVAVTTTTIKTDCALIIQDYDKRQMPRFRDNPPGDTCKDAVMKLSQMSFGVYTGTKKIDFVNLREGLKILNGEILNSFKRIEQYEKKLKEILPSTDIASFEREFSVVFKKKGQEREYNKLKNALSYEAMALYPDYKRRLEVLRELRYIDDQNRVAMKGRVACEMKTNELIITELVFRNILSELEPAKIAALLSCLVFQARTNSELKIEKSLQASMKAIEAIDNELRSVEDKYQVGLDDPTCLAERLNFGLVQVVYEWAKGKPFSEIVNLTDVQEGIIVRNIQQLHEVLANVKDAAKIIGDPLLQSKMEEVSVAIKRDIVFFASLYTQEDIINI